MLSELGELREAPPRTCRSMLSETGEMRKEALAGRVPSLPCPCKSILSAPGELQNGHPPHLKAYFRSPVNSEKEAFLGVFRVGADRQHASSVYLCADDLRCSLAGGLVIG